MDQAARDGHDPPVTHLLNLTCASVLFYASVTRGGLVLARVLERVVHL